MASTMNQQQSFPVVPPLLSAGDHEIRDYNTPGDASRPTLNQTPYLKPYLGLRARLSQILINRWTILLILVLIRLMFAIMSADDSLVSARREALSACTQVESIGSSMASLPHYAAQGFNEQTAKGVESAVSGLMTMMDMSVTGVEEIVLFVIHMMTSTYLCLITLAIRGSLGAAVEIGTQITKGLNQTIDEVTKDMGDATKKVTDGINTVLSKIEGLPFVDGFEKPSIDLSEQIKKLNALEVPPEMQQGLEKLNGSIPTFEEVQNFTDNVIRVPFEEVKKLIRGMDTFEFDRQLLPVPQKEQLNFCSEGNSINDFFDDLVKMTVTAKKIGLAVLIVLAIVVIVPMAWTEIRRFRRMQEHSSRFQNGYEPMDVVYMASRPHSSSWGLWLGQRFGSSSRQSAVRWIFAYATSLPMLFLLSLGIAGLFSCFCQYLLVKAFQKKVPELTSQVADFAEKVVTSLNNASMSWSTGVNGAMGDLDSKINEDMLSWVNTTTTAINGTLNSFVEKMSGALNDTFGGTPLEGPIKDVLNCLIGLKIASFQKGLTWVQDNAHVSFPSVNNNTFSLGALAELSDSDSAAELLKDPNGKAKDEVTEAVAFVVDKLISGIKTEALISLGIIVIWLIYVIIGLIYGCVWISRHKKNPENKDPYFISDSVANTEKAQEYPDAVPPAYEYSGNKSAPLTVRTFPTYSENETEVHSGQVGSHVVGEPSRPGHLRASSHGHLADPSPADEKYDNPFLHSDEKKHNPFR